MGVPPYHPATPKDAPMGRTPFSPPPAPPPWRSILNTSVTVSCSGQRAIDLLKSTQNVPADSTPLRALTVLAP